MPFVEPEANERSLAGVLRFIMDEDDCSRSRAWEQFRRMGMSPLRRRYLWSALWADRKPAPPGDGLPLVRPSDNVGPFGGWETATLEDDGRVCFGSSPARAIKIAPWSHFLLMWNTYQRPRQAAKPDSSSPAASEPQDTAESPNTVSYTDLKATIKTHGRGTEAQLVAHAKRAFPEKHVPRAWVRRARNKLFGKPDLGRPKASD